jgi:hypothetical protein
MSSRRKKKLRPAEIMTINLAVCDLGISGNITVPFLIWGFKLNHSKLLIGSEITLVSIPFCSSLHKSYLQCLWIVNGMFSEKEIIYSIFIVFYVPGC